MKYVIKENNALKIVFHSGPLPEEIKPLAIAPKDAMANYGDIIELEENSREPFGYKAKYITGKLEEKKQEMKIYHEQKMIQKQIEKNEMLNKLKNETSTDKKLSLLFQYLKIKT